MFTFRRTAIAAILLMIAGTGAYGIAQQLQGSAAKQEPGAEVESDWKSLDDFKASLPKLLSSPQERFNISALADRLSSYRVAGHEVCAQDEITAAQYIELVAILDKISWVSPDAEAQLNSILEQDKPITDCLFRVLYAATVTATPPLK
jgi:hypothetical protein